VLRHAGDFAARARQFRWVAYLSTTGVYGDHGGGLVTEETPLTPNTERGHKRLLAETQWLDLWRSHGLPVHIFRLAGIYGPGRNQLLSLLDGTAKRVIKQGQVFSRIHVEDIANVLEASMAKPQSRRRLQCLRRRGLAAAGCGGTWREASGTARAARYALRGGDAVAHGAELLCRFEARLE
jgi:nucleoside-diphosphate-sugar epimerase